MKNFAAIFALVVATLGINTQSVAAPITLNFVSTGNQPATGTLILPDDTLLTTGSYSFYYNLTDTRSEPPAIRPTGTGTFTYPLRNLLGDYSGTYGTRTGTLNGNLMRVSLGFSNGLITGGFDVATFASDSYFLFRSNAFEFALGFGGENSSWRSDNPGNSGVTLGGYWDVASAPVPLAPTHLLFALGLALSFTVAQKRRQ
jgi:hypothetical protein